MRTPKSYRLDQVSLNRLAWLATHLKTTETSAVELAITNLYMSEYYNLGNVRLAPSTPMCCRPICEQCPLESTIAAGLDICANDCAAANCPYYRD